MYSYPVIFETCDGEIKLVHSHEGTLTDPKTGHMYDANRVLPLRFPLEMFGLSKSTMKKKYYYYDNPDHRFDVECELLDRKTSYYTLDELLLLNGAFVFSASDECCLDNQDDYTSLEIHNARRNENKFENTKRRIYKVMQSIILPVGYMHVNMNHDSHSYVATVRSLKPLCDYIAANREREDGDIEIELVSSHVPEWFESRVRKLVQQPYIASSWSKLDMY